MTEIGVAAVVEPVRIFDAPIHIDIVALHLRFWIAGFAAHAPFCPDWQYGFSFQLRVGNLVSHPVSAAASDNFDAPLELARWHVTRIYDNDLTDQFSKRGRFDPSGINTNAEFEGRFADLPHSVSGLGSNPSEKRSNPGENHIREGLRAVLVRLGWERYRDHHIWHPTFPALRRLLVGAHFDIAKVFWQNSRVVYVSAIKPRHIAS